MLVLIALAVAAAIVAAMFLQVTTERALERAEALGLRRMLVTRLDADDHVYRFFFATNREPAIGDTDANVQFANARRATLTYGHFDTSIEPSLGIGMLINPTDWFQNEEIQLEQVSPLGRKEFVAALSDQVQASPYRSLLVKINGFREQFPSALRKTAFVAHVLDIDSPVLLFDWPGDQGSSLRGYRRAQAIARESGAELAGLLDLVVNEIEAQRVWILANSMGGEVVVSAFTQLHEEEAFADAALEFEDVVLTAPDVSHEEFGNRFRDEIASMTRNLTVYVSSNDRALLISRIVNRQRRLGESRFDPARPDQADEALKALEMVDPGSDRVMLIDVTPINRTRNFHNFSLETPEFFDDLYLRMTNTQTPSSRLHHRVATPSGAEYWVLAPGR